MATSASLIIFKAVSTRFIFLTHGFIVIYFYVCSKENVNYWLLTIPSCLLAIETTYSLLNRKGQEYTYFWPCGFLYISSIIPVIWYIETDLFHRQLFEEESKTAGENFTSLKAYEREKIEAEIFMNAVDNRNFILKRACEVGLVIGLIIGRWLVPRGRMTKEQLSGLLLLYVGNSADILELLGTLEEPDIYNEYKVFIVVMCLFTLAMYQFCLVVTLQKPKIEKVLLEKTENALSFGRRELSLKLNRTAYITSIKNRNRKLSTKRGKGKVHNSSSLTSRVSHLSGHSVGLLQHTSTTSRASTLSEREQVKQDFKRREVHGETFQILVTLLMQDGPFLMFRIYMTIVFSLSSEIQIFFICKNAIVSILLIYRLLVLSCYGVDEESKWHCEDVEARIYDIQFGLEKMKTAELSMRIAKVPPL